MDAQVALLGTHALMCASGKIYNIYIYIYIYQALMQVEGVEQGDVNLIGGLFDAL